MLNCSGAVRVAVCAAFLGCCTTQPSRAEHSALLTPTGNYSVGRTFLYWTDPKRTDPVAARTGTKREFMVIAWYPADTSEVHALWMPERWAFSEAKLLYAQRRNSPNPLTMAEALRAVHESVSSSIAEARPAPTKNLWPLLLFSPGAGVNPAFYSTFTEDLASHGYAVFSVVPTGWVDTIFPDGHRVAPSDKLSDDDRWTTRIALPLWAGDLRFTLDQIERLDRDPNSIFFHRLDLSRLGAFGHSFGGAASILAGLQDRRIRAVLNLDGSPFGVLSKTVLRKPLMVIKEDVSPKYWTAPRDEKEKAMQAKVGEELSSVYLNGRPGYRVEITDAKHMTFCDMAVLPAWADFGRRFGADNAADAETTLSLIRDYVRAFFDKFLLGLASPLLDRAPGKYGISILSRTN
jgi:Platelet-activating factor acetylhydrolase, isoform II